MPTMDRIYRRELARLLDEGLDGCEASRIARQRADEIYYRMADEADKDGPHHR